MASDVSISVILTAWNRPQYFEEQVAAVFGQTVRPCEVVLWYNQPSKGFGIFKGKQSVNFKGSNQVKKIICDYNFGVIPRFSLAPCLEGEYICIFDDDTIPGDRWFENCLGYIDKENCILGTIGLRFLSLDRGSVMTQKPRMGWEAANEDLEFVDVVGHCWFFRREWARFFWYEAPLVRTFGEDIHFCAMLRKQGIRAACPPHPQSEKSLWGSLYSERGVDSVAISSSKGRSSDYHDVVTYEISRGFFGSRSL